MHHRLIHGITKTSAYINNILISGATMEEHTNLHLASFLSIRQLGFAQRIRGEKKTRKKKRNSQPWQPIFLHSTKINFQQLGEEDD